MTKEQKQVREFMESCGQVVSDIPMIPNRDTILLRVDLITEEFVKELIPAMLDGDLVKVADALADLKYVIDGTAVSFGIDLDPVFQEVHRSNMTKLIQGSDGALKPLRRSDGKILKPASYQPPNLGPIIEAQLNP